MVFLWFSHGCPMVFLWFASGVPSVFLWFSYGFPMVFLWFSLGFLKIINICMQESRDVYYDFAGSRCGTQHVFERFLWLAMVEGANDLMRKLNTVCQQATGN